MMWKTSFGDSLRSKTEIAMKNELYCKLICHNISCLIKGMYELRIVRWTPKMRQLAKVEPCP